MISTREPRLSGRGFALGSTVSHGDPAGSARWPGGGGHGAMEEQRAGKEGQRGDGSLLPKMTNPQSVSQSAGTGGSGMRVEAWMASPNPP